MESAERLNMATEYNRYRKKSNHEYRKRLYIFDNSGAIYIFKRREYSQFKARSAVTLYRWGDSGTVVGKVTGQRISTNRDGNKNVRLLQVEFIENEDTRTIEVFCPMDYNPANNTLVNIINVSGSYQIAIGFSDGLTPEVSQGEYEIYSTDNPVTAKQARIKLNSSGEIILNGGVKSSVNYPDTVNALNTFLTALNGQLTGLGAPGGLVIDLTLAEVPEVKL